MQPKMRNLKENGRLMLTDSNKLDGKEKRDQNSMMKLEQF